MPGNTPAKPRRQISTPLRTFSVGVFRGVLEIRFRGEFRDSQWSYYFGETQVSLERATFRGKPFDAVLVDFSRLSWADPIPLLSLRLALYYSAVHRSQSLPFTVLFPDASSMTSCVRKFLAQEGFFRMYAEGAQGVKSGGQIVTDQYATEIRWAREQTPLHYRHASAVTAKMFLLPRHDDVLSVVEEIINEAQSRGSDHDVPNASRADVLYNIRSVLQETLSNCHLHAYEGTSRISNRQPAVALYVRFRHGLYNAPPDQLVDLDATLRKEAAKCPRLTKRSVEDVVGFYDVFVVDQGVGLVSSLNGRMPELMSHDELTELRKRLPEVFDRIFLKGERRKNQLTAKYTNVGGLQLLSSLLSRNNDFVRTVELNAWYGGTLPINRGNLEFEHHGPSSGAFQEGLAWNCRIVVPRSRTETLPAADPITELLQAYVVSVIHEHPAVSAIPEREEVAEESKWIRVVDDRHRSSAPSSVNEVPYSALEPDWLVLRPRPGLSANTIAGYVAESLASERQKCGTHPLRTLVIADVTAHETPCFVRSLDRLSHYAAERISQAGCGTIVMLREDCSAATWLVEQDRCRFIPLNEVAVRLGKELVQGPDIVKKAVHHVRRFDSFLFWERVKKNHPKAFIQGKIQWAFDPSGRCTQYLSCFLDLTSVLADADCRSLLQQALRRLPAHIGVEGRMLHLVLRPADGLVADLAQEFNIGTTPQDGMQCSFRLVGIRCSAPRATMQQDMAPSSEPLHLAFFNHSDYSPRDGASALALLLWPSVEWVKRMFPPGELDVVYARLGHEPYLEIVSGEVAQQTGDQGIQLACAVKQLGPTFADFQTPPARLRLGHWNYQGHHDVVCPNLWLVASHAFSDWAPPAAFLLAAVLHYLDQAMLTDVDEMTAAVQRARIVKRDVFIWNERTKLHAGCAGIILYPSHPTMDAIVRRLREVLPTGAATAFLPVAVLHASGGHTAVRMASLAATNIKQRLGRAARKGVLVLDDVYGSGRTSVEVSHRLRSLGADSVHYVSLLDRVSGVVPSFSVDCSVPQADGLQCNPFDSAMTYWAFPLPRLAGDSQCALCRAADVGAKFKRQLFDVDASSLLGKWLNQMAPASVVSDWGNRGVNPRKLGDKIGSATECNLPPFINTTTATVLYEVARFATAGSDVRLLASLHNNKERLGPQGVLEVVSSVLLLFLPAIRAQMRTWLIKEAVEALESGIRDSKFRCDAPVVSLFAVTFMGLDDDTLAEGVREALDSSLLQVDNEATRLLLAYVMSRIPTLMADDRPWMRAARNCLRVHERLADLYNYVHLAAYCVEGRQHWPHMRELQQSAVLTSDIALAKLMENVSREANRLAWIVSQIDDHLLRSPSSEDDSRDPSGTLLAALKPTVSLAKQAAQAIRSNKMDAEQLAQAAQISTVTTLAAFEKFEDTLFVRVNVSDYNTRLVDPLLMHINRIMKSVLGGSSWSELLAQRGNVALWPEPSVSFRCLSSGLPFPQTRNREVWVLWDRVTETNFADLCLNVVYRTRPMRCPLDIIHDDAVVDLWVSCSYTSEYALVQLMNACNTDADTDSMKPRYSHLEALGGKVETEIRDIGGTKVWVSKMMLPYAGRFTRLRKG